ncbi:MAG: antibiotic biosynthesis monooxygenase [Flavobacteriaceae bacterium]|nr:antibiotic biosynthesis monooxygenase [Flavobacteriaceae bacterium]
MIAKTPKTPYYAVIFTSLRTDEDPEYNKMSKRMVALAEEQKGFLGIESAKEELGITVSYWDSLESIRAWKSVDEHRKAQKKGIEKWYAAYKVRICKVENDYEF